MRGGAAMAFRCGLGKRLAVWASVLLESDANAWRLMAEAIVGHVSFLSLRGEDRLEACPTVIGTAVHRISGRRGGEG